MSQMSLLEGTDLSIKMMTPKSGLPWHEEGATAVEYAIMVALIAVVIIVAVTAVGSTLNESLECVASAVGALPGVDDCVR